MPVNIRTLGRSAEFTYEGSVSAGLRLTYGPSRTSTRVTAEALRQLLDHFNQIDGPVEIGASRTNSPPGSLGAWWKEHQPGPQLASYLAAVLVAQGYAQVAGTRLVFSRKPG